MPRWALAAALVVGACRGPEPTHARCRDAVRARGDEAITVCRAVYAATGNARDGAWLARALADRGAPLADVRALAERVGDQPAGAEAWNAVGDLLRVAGDRPAAIAAYRRAFEHRAPDDHRGRVRDAQGLYQQLAAIDDYRSALHYAGIADAESRLVGEPVLRGYVLTGIGGLLHDLGDIPAVEAIVLEAARVVDEQSPFYVHRRHLEAIVHIERGRFELAHQTLTEVARLAPAQHLDGIERYAKLGLVANELRAGNAAAAAELLAATRLAPARSTDQTIHEAYLRAEVAAALGDFTAALAAIDAVATDVPAAWLARLDAARGRALARLGRTAEAEAALLRALDHIERAREELGLDAMKPWLLRDWRHAFQDLFVLYVEHQRPYEAWAVVQRASARSLLDGLVDRGARPNTPVATALADAAARVDAVRTLTRSLRSSPTAALPDARALLASLGPRHTITLFAAAGALWRIVTRPGSAPRIDRIGPTAELARHADALLANVDDADAARALGDRLFPREILPERDATLYVALDEPVHHVPLAALRVDGDFLVRRHPLALMPSAAVLATLVQATPRTGPAVVLGDAMGDLSNARAEATDVAAQLATTAALGTAATRDRIGANARLLHVATHARTTPLGAALVLADGLLTSGEIVDRGLAADVVVLASCASADPLDPDELGPLAHAFLAAGSHAVVATRWSVDDAVARRFAQYFYEADGARSPIRATAAAQRRMIDDQIPTTQWAMFVVLGERAHSKEGHGK